MKTLVFSMLSASMMVMMACSSSKVSNNSLSASGSTLKVSGPGSSPDTISFKPKGPRKYYVILKSARKGPGSSPDTIAVQSNEPVIIYSPRDDKN